MKTILPLFLTALRLLALLTCVTGVLYPLAIWAAGHAFFRQAAEGSLLTRDGRPVGSALLAQKTIDPRYIHPRPSAGDYATIPSSASNQSWTSAHLITAVSAAADAFRASNQLPAAHPLPSDAITQSGSGLDPHISLDNARLQLPRIARARGLTPSQLPLLETLLARHTEGGRFTPARVNVLRLNLALDTTFR